ncbi:MAG: arginine--tRNA ligase [Alphaproteobacteria bacterium]|nr:arginine--tRNA ligase [Alphaproteobacteria bacterium]
MNLFSNILKEMHACLEALAAQGKLPQGMDFSSITVEPPRDPSHGDMATNAAMVLAKPAGRKPQELAAELVAEIKARGIAEEASVAGPGFINLRFKPEFWQGLLPEILRLGTAYGDSAIGQGKTINVEYVSANPTGPMHVGHARGAVYGDALAALLEKSGHKVTREYYINDAGAQIEVLARSTFLRYREALGDTVTIPDGYYPGAYLRDVGKALAEIHGGKLLDMPDEEWLAIVKPFAVEKLMGMIREDLAALGIEHDVFASEKKLHETGKVEEALKALEAKGLIYQGVLEPPKGKLPDDWEAREQTLFKSTEFGDDVDRALKKSDGSWTYFAADIAYHWDKYKRGSDALVDVWGADHGGYIKRVRAALAALTGGKAGFDVKICQLVNLLEGGQPVKMSKRSGTFVTLRDVVDEVGKGVVRFIMLTRKNDAPLDFDLVKVKEQSKDNPVFYVQYAHARCRSVLRHANAEYPQIVGKMREREAVLLLTDPAEMEVIRLLGAWPRTVEAAAKAYEPHRIAFYLEELAAAFHALWNKGRDHAALRFISPDHTMLTAGRLALVGAVAATLASGLGVFGVEPVEEMR